MQSLFYRGVDLAEAGGLTTLLDFEAAVPIWKAMGNDGMVAMAHVQMASIRFERVA